MKIYKYIILSLLLLFLTNCSTDSDNKLLLEQEVNYKLKRHTINKLDKCRANALEDAEIYVDSIITEYTKNAIKSDLEFPMRPTRDTSSEKYNVEIDSIDMQKLVDSLEIGKTNIDTIQVIDTLTK